MKKYQTVDDIPHDQLDAIVELLKAGRLSQADTDLRAILANVKDIKDFEAKHLARRLLDKAREVNAVPVESETL